MSIRVQTILVIFSLVFTLSNAIINLSYADGPQDIYWHAKNLTPASFCVLLLLCIWLRMVLSRAINIEDFERVIFIDPQAFPDVEMRFWSLLKLIVVLISYYKTSAVLLSKDLDHFYANYQTDPYIHRGGFTAIMRFLSYFETSLCLLGILPCAYYAINAGFVLILFHLRRHELEHIEQLVAAAERAARREWQRNRGN